MPAYSHEQKNRIYRRLQGMGRPPQVKVGTRILEEIGRYILDGPPPEGSNRFDKEQILNFLLNLDDNQREPVRKWLEIHVKDWQNDAGTHEDDIYTGYLSTGPEDKASLARLTAIARILDKNNLAFEVDKRKIAPESPSKPESVETQKRKEVMSFSPPPVAPSYTTPQPISTAPTMPPAKSDAQENNEKILKLLKDRQEELSRQSPQKSAGVFSKAKTALKDSMTGAEDRRFAINIIIDHVQKNYIQNKASDVLNFQKVLDNIADSLSPKDKEKFKRGISIDTSGKKTAENLGQSKFAKMYQDIVKVASSEKTDVPKI